MHRSILIVEDDLDIGEALQDSLLSEGYTVLMSKNGREALDSLASNTDIGLIILDQKMPEVNGQEFLAIRQSDMRLKQIPVIMISAATRREDCFPEVVFTLSKPFELELLLESIEKYYKS